MASSSSSPPPRTWTYRVFTSFHGPDVRQTFLSHLRKQFSCNGISMFNDQGIERGQTIAPALTEAIRESRISIVVLSKNYASSSWCLDELVEILKCKEGRKQIVMTVFYGVDPSDVRKQNGDFERVFNETCARRTEEERRRWSQALTDVGEIAGEDFKNWANEADMIEKIARDVSNKLNTTISWDFEDMVGIEAHLQKMQSLLYLEYEEAAMMVGISGPAGIGKTTIARALHSRLSSSFDLTCFMENIRGSYDSGLDEYGLKLRLQEQLLSKTLNQNGMKIHHLCAIQERLCDQKVLIILDDVDDRKQLEALAKENIWFGPGSRIIVTTKDQELLEQHGISNTYKVDFPTNEETRKMFCTYAFGQSFAPDGFEKLAERGRQFCSNLPLSLRVIGSTLRGKNEEEWEGILRMQENSLDRDIEGKLRVEYDNLHKDAQLLFLLIAFFFNDQHEDHVKAMLDDSNLDVRLGLKTLVNKSLVKISTEGEIVMHKLLQQVAREAVQRQDQGKSQILIDTDEICDVLENESGSVSVMGISLDISTLTRDVNISARAFKRIRNLRFLRIYQTSLDEDKRVHVPKDINFPPRLRLLHWEHYMGKCLPPTFRPEYLVELNMPNTKLEKLWEGIEPLTNLKKMNLSNSMDLWELPDLSEATNLESLNLDLCMSLVKIPSSVANLQKLKRLDMRYCVELQDVPTHFNLASLEYVDMVGCYGLRKFPDIFRNINTLIMTYTMLQDHLPQSIRLWSRLQTLFVCGSDNLPPFVAELYLARGPDIEEIPDCIKDLHGLVVLSITGCPQLASLPNLPASLRRLIVDNCESLETLMPFPSVSPIHHLEFTNSWKLGEEARRVITQQSCCDAWLPGRNVPTEFTHRAIGNSLIIPSGAKEYRYCVVVSPKQQMVESADLLFYHQSFSAEHRAAPIPKLQTEHLFIRHVELAGPLVSESVLEFSTMSKDIDIIECGFQSFTGTTNQSYESSSEHVPDRRNKFDDSIVERPESSSSSPNPSTRSENYNALDNPNPSSMARSHSLRLRSSLDLPTSRLKLGLSSLGLLRIRIKRGVNLAVRDLISSDPYVIIDIGEERWKTEVIYCNVNPVWNEDVNLSVTDPNLTVLLTVYDHDTFTKDDYMGDAEFTIKPYFDSLNQHLEGHPCGTIVTTIRPSLGNCLAKASHIIWFDGKLVQDLILKLRHVECGEVEVQLQWIDLP